MEIILIVLTSTLLSACFFATYQSGIKKGIDMGKKEIKDEQVEVTKKNQKQVRGVIDFINFNG